MTVNIMGDSPKFLVQMWNLKGHGTLMTEHKGNTSHRGTEMSTNSNQGKKLNDNWKKILWIFKYFPFDFRSFLWELGDFGQCALPVTQWGPSYDCRIHRWSLCVCICGSSAQACLSSSSSPYTFPRGKAPQSTDKLPSGPVEKRETNLNSVA